MVVVKWAIFVVAVLAARPVGRWLRGHPALQVHAWSLVGLLPFLAPRYMSLIFFGSTPGDTNGIEVGVLDWVVLCLLYATRRVNRPLPFRLVLSIYFAVAVVSIPQAHWMLVATGYVWKLGRMYLLFLAVWRAGNADSRVPGAILRGLTIGLVCAGAVTVWQHYVLGVRQATGTFGHQNTLGVVTNLVVMPAFARIFAGRTPLLTKLGPAAAVAVSLFTESRGAVLFLALGCSLLFVLSLYRKFTTRKAWIGLAAMVLAAAIAPLALKAVTSRTVEDRTLSLESRGQFERAASMMLQEHPFGVGPGHYAVELLLGGYGARAGIWWGSWVSIVHNIYWLTAAEMGYAGLVALVLLFLAPLRMAFGYGLRRTRGRQADVLLGLGVGMLTLYVHSSFEWVWRLPEVSYVYFMIVGMVPVLARQLHLARSRRPAPATAGPEARTPPGEAPQRGTRLSGPPPRTGTA